MARSAKRLAAAIGLMVLLSATPAPGQNPAGNTDFTRGAPRGPAVPAAGGPADRYAPRGDVGGRFPPDTPAARRPAARPVPAGNQPRYNSAFPEEPRYSPEDGQPRPNGNSTVTTAGHTTARNTPPAGSTFPGRQPAPGLRISRDDDSRSGASGKPAGSRSAAGGLWTSFASLAALILVLVGGARLWKKHGPRHATAVPTEAVEILGRRPLDVRHSVVLVRLGSRILVLGSGPGGLQTLTELSDPVEVDFLAGQCRRQDSESTVAQTFRSLFQLESGKAAHARETAAASSAAAPSAVGSPYEPASHTASEPYPAIPGYPATSPHAPDSRTAEEQPAPADDRAGHPADYTVYQEQPAYHERPATAGSSPAFSHEGDSYSVAADEAADSATDDEQRRRDTAAILERLRMHSGGTAADNASNHPHTPLRPADSRAAEGGYDAAG